MATETLKLKHYSLYRKSCFVRGILAAYIYVLFLIIKCTLVNEVESSKKNIDGKKKLDFFDAFGEILGWIQIMVSLLLLAAIIGFLVYISNPNTTRLIIGIAITAVGLII